MPERPPSEENLRALTTEVDAAVEATRGQRRVLGDAPARVITSGAQSVIASELWANGADALHWNTPAKASGPVVLTAELALYGAVDRVVALAASDGTQRWALSARGQTLLAASRSAGRTALLLGDRAGQRSLAICDDAGREQLRVVADGVLGAPALLTNLLLAPFGDGNVAVIDVGAGSERGRTRLGVRPLDAWLTSDGVFFGGPPWSTLGAHTASYTLPRRPLPGVVLAGSAPEPPSPHPDVTRLYVQPSASPPEPDVYVATFGRIAFGMERERGSLLWVAALPGRVLAGELVASGLLVCDDSGALHLLSAQGGHVVRAWQLGRRRRAVPGEAALLGCALGPLGWGAELTASATTDEPPLLEQLARVLALSDPGLTEAQRFLSRELAARPEPEATRVLIELVTRRSLDRVLQSEAEDLLAIRRNGQDYMLAALASGGRGDDATALPPIAPLGEALAALDERRAAPLLARQLNRPAHTAAALARAAAALEQLASEAEYDELSVFFSLHRTNADSAELIAAVVSVGKTLLRVAEARARPLVGTAMRDPLTVPEVRAALELALKERPEPAPASESAETTSG